MSSAASTTIAPVRMIRLRQIALPTEHGGWGILLEPLVAGLAIAFSPAAPWIALLTIGAFLARQPLKVLITDRLGMRNHERAAAAFGFVVLYSGIFAAGLAGTLATTGPRPLLPFVFIIPFAVLQIHSDVFGRRRQLIPELTGAVSISASVAVIALAAGLPWVNAVALWMIFVSRFVPSILYVRNRLLLEKGKEFSRVAPTLAHVAALLLVAILAIYGLSPFLTVFAMLLLLYRAASGLSPNRRKMRAMQIGVWETIYGTLTVVSVVAGHFAGF
jgi:cytochrome b561